MTRVYGGCIEPGGWLLENSVVQHECEACGGRGFTQFREAAEGGSLNSYTFTGCKDCDFEHGDLGEDC